MKRFFDCEFVLFIVFPVASICLCATLFHFLSHSDSLVASSADESSVEETSVAKSVSDLPVFERQEFDLINGTINHIYIWTDEETGVQYIIYHEKCGTAGFGGITPRLNPDGSLYVVSDDLK